MLSAFTAEVSPRPFGAASQSPPRPSCTITVLQIAGTPCRAANDRQLGSHDNAQTKPPMLRPLLVAA